MNLHPAHTASRQLDLNLLELFDSIYRTSNLTATGELLGLSQPAVSRGLAKLRDIYDDPLFVRQQRGVQATPFAQQLFEPIASALAIVRSTVDKPVFDPPREQRCFKLAMSDIGERYFMPKLLRQLARSAPHVTIQVLSPDRVDFLAALAAGDIDLGVGYFPNLGKQVHVKRLFKENFTYIARKKHPALEKSLSLAKLRTLQHVVANPPGTQHAATVQKILFGKRIQAPVALEVRSFLCVGPIVAETDLVSVVPCNLAGLVAEHLHLQLLPPPVRFSGFDVNMVWHQRFGREEGRTWLRELFFDLFHKPA